jgi:hypothetical protein
MPRIKRGKVVRFPRETLLGWLDRHKRSPRQNHSPSRNAPAPRNFARCRAHAPDCRSGVGTPAATSSLRTCSLREFARAGRCS